LVIYSDAVTSGPVAFQFFKPVARKIRHIRQTDSHVEPVEGFLCLAPKGFELPDPFSSRKLFRRAVAIAPDHSYDLACVMRYVKHN
jgi:hypothetical protein